MDEPVALCFPERATVGSGDWIRSPDRLNPILWRGVLCVPLSASQFRESDSDGPLGFLGFALVR